VIRFLPPYRAENKLKLFLLFGFHPEHQTLTASADFIQAIVEQRAYKSPEEIAEIERAVDLSVDMHTAAMRMARPGMAEAEIVARVTEIALASGGDLAHPIVATTHGEVIRNPHHDLVLENGQMFLLNAGAATPRHYPGDLTSAFPVNRTFSARQKEVYQIVWNALQDATAALKPGLWFQDAHLTACKTLVEGLKALGLMKGGVDEAVAQGAHALFFPHGLGHMLGLDVHDMEDLGEEWVGYEGRPRSGQFGLKALRLAREMRPGFVFTLEPGLYFIPELMDRWQAEQKFAAFIDYPRLEPYRTFGGIRLGENHVMQEHGSRRLGKPLSRIPSEIEVVRGGS
jgi:Xaa-Pro aminopeptidase